MKTVEQELKLNWFDLNKLTLNLSKTKYIIFGNRTVKTNKILAINDVEIDKVSEVKFLGVLIDNKLCWKPHINYIKAKIAKSIAILYKVKDILNKSSLYMLYCSFILPYISYCLEVWGNAYKTTTNPVFILQKRAIRIVSKVAYREPSNQLFIKLKALKFKDLVDLKIVHLMYKAEKNELPENILQTFTRRESHYDLRGVCMFDQPLVRTNTKEHCISVRGVRIWNKCRDELKQCTTWNRFKRMFKNDIINRYRIEE